MQQLHKRGEGSPAHAFGTAAPEEDPDDGEQPQCLHQVGFKFYPWALDETIDAIIPIPQGAERPGEHCCGQTDAKGGT